MPGLKHLSPAVSAGWGAAAPAQRGPGGETGTQKQSTESDVAARLRSLQSGTGHLTAYALEHSAPRPRGAGARGPWYCDTGAKKFSLESGRPPGGHVPAPAVARTKGWIEG